MKLTISTAASRESLDWTPRDYTWAALVDRLRTPVIGTDTLAEYQAMSRDDRLATKDIGGYVGGYVKGRRIGRNVKSRQLLALDADYASPSFWSDFQDIYDCAACVHSTRSHTPENPRLRLLIPLSREVDALEYEAIARRVAGDLNIELFDSTTYEFSRLMFWPSICSDAVYYFAEQEGDPLDADAVLARYEDWHDSAKWPVNKATEDRVRGSAKEAGNPLEKPGLIGAFCRTYRIPEAIAKFLPDVYEETEVEGRYTYTGGTSTGGAIVYNDGLFLYSHHDHDPCHGRSVNAYDLVRIHKYGELDKDAAPDTPLPLRPSTTAMTELCAEDEAVKASYHEQSRRDFDSKDRKYARELQDADVAQRIADRYRDKLMYNDSLGWLYWTGSYWKPGAFVACMEAIFSDLNDLLVVAHDELSMAIVGGDKNEIASAQAYLKKVRGLRSSGKIFGFERLLRAKLPIQDVNILDKDPWILNTPAGELDLRTGEMKPNSPDHYCTHITGCAPARGDSPMWDSFLEYALQGDKALEEYMQLICGYAAVGHNNDECMFIAWGPGSNGKSTMFDTLLEVFGSYAGTIRSSVLIEKGNGSEPYGMDEARGKRLILMGELDQNARLSVSTMKSLTSKDIIQVNPKYGKLFSFRPTHKLILHTNWLPSIAQFDYGTIRRLRVIPFTAKPKPDNERIPDLMFRMVRDEGPQILKWVCDGAKKFYERGGTLGDPPEVVKKTTQGYLEENDRLSQFIREFCQVGETYRMRRQELYDLYRRWANQQGFLAKSQQAFNKELEARVKVTRIDANCARDWLGIRLNSESIEQMEKEVYGDDV